MERGNYERNSAEIRKETPRGNNERTPNYFFFDLYSFQMWLACLNTCSDSRLSSEKLFRCFKWKCFFFRKGEDHFRKSKIILNKYLTISVNNFLTFQVQQPTLPPKLPPNISPLWDVFAPPVTIINTSPCTHQPILFDQQISMYILETEITFSKIQQRFVLGRDCQTSNIQFPKFLNHVCWQYIHDLISSQSQHC